jgi:hypothetical protein
MCLLDYHEQSSRLLIEVIILKRKNIATLGILSRKLPGYNLFRTTGGNNMVLNVIYTDGTSGKIKSSTLDGVRKSGKIIAFHCSEGWVDVRRKNKSAYNGLDRRTSTQEMFFAGFNS